MMMRIEHVADADDPRLDDYRDLKDHERRSRLEPERGCVIVEGHVPIRVLLGSTRGVRSLLVIERERARLADAITARRDVDAPVLVVEPELLDAVAGFRVHRGALASAERFELAPLDHVLGAARRVVVLEAAVDLANVGTVVRTARALGIDAVLLCPRCADPLTRRAVRVSSGHVLDLPLARLPDDAPGGLEPLRAAGFTLVALTPAAGSEPLDALVPAPGERLALLVGSEGPGLSAAALAAADRRVRIPLAPGVDSLNLGVAAAIAMWALR